MANSEILNLLISNFILIVLILVSILKIIPPEWAGFWKYNNNREADGLAPKITFLNLVLSNSFDSVIRSVFIPLIASFGLKNMATLIIFLVVIFDVFYRHEISGAGVTLISVGILTLYLERL